MSFDPYNLTPIASLNRLRIVDLPGLSLPAEVQGKIGFELASAAYVAEQVRQHSDSLGLSAEDLARDERDLPLLLDHCFQSDNAQVRGAAYGIAMKLGRNLACLLLTLKRGDAVNRAARTDWDDSVWDYWQTIRLVRFGGGLVSGNLRQAITPGIGIGWDRILSREQLSNLKLRVGVAAYGASLPLVGLARYASPDVDHSLVLDFGGSFVKRGLAIYHDGKLMELRLLPSVPTQFNDPGQAVFLFSFIVAEVIKTWDETVRAGFSPSPITPVSLAAYIVSGQPAQRQGGIYAALQDLSENVQSALSETISQQLNSPIHIRLFHDGTAAASAFAGANHTAVITLGTALGIGFPPSSDENLRPLADPLKISQLQP